MRQKLTQLTLILGQIFMTMIELFREPLKGDINTKYHESTATISKDGNTMYRRIAI